MYDLEMIVMQLAVTNALLALLAGVLILKD